jgi:hypothetical protein
VETETELEQLQHGGLFKYVLRDLLARDGEGRPLAIDRDAMQGREKPPHTEAPVEASAETEVENADEKVGEADEESFPASDAPATTGVLGVGKRKLA